MLPATLACVARTSPVESLILQLVKSGRFKLFSEEMCDGLGLFEPGTQEESAEFSAQSDAANLGFAVVEI